MNEQSGGERARASSGAPCISVIVPVYNTARYLDQMLDSILNQTLQDIEVICVNDGSTDSSLDVLKRRAQEDDRLIVVDQENAGAGAARNNGLQRVHGEYCTFVDSDDFIELDALEKAYTAAKETKADVVIFNIDQYAEEEDLYKPMNHAIVKGKVPFNQVFDPAQVPNFYKYMVGFTVTKLYRWNYLKALDISFPPIGAHEDMPYSYVACTSTTAMYAIPEVLYHYRRQRQGSLSDGTNNTHVYMLEALECFKQDLVKSGAWERNERNFRNYVLHMVQWKFGDLKGIKKAQMVEDLRNEWLERLDVGEREEGYYYEEAESKLLSDILKQDYVTQLEKQVKALNKKLEKQKASNKELKEEIKSLKTSGTQQGQETLSGVKKRFKRFL